MPADTTTLALLREARERLDEFAYGMPRDVDLLSRIGAHLEASEGAGVEKSFADGIAEGCELAASACEDAAADCMSEAQRLDLRGRRSSAVGMAIAAGVLLDTMRAVLEIPPKHSGAPAAGEPAWCENEGEYITFSAEWNGCDLVVDAQDFAIASGEKPGRTRWFWEVYAPGPCPPEGKPPFADGTADTLDGAKKAAALASAGVR